METGTPKPTNPSRLTASALNTGRAMARTETAPEVGHLRLEGELSPRECATVLHGLRMIQENANGPEDCVSGTCEHFEDYPQLTDAEIDTLAERINLGPVAPQSKTWTPEDAREAIHRKIDAIPQRLEQLNAAVELCGSLAASLKEAHASGGELLDTAGAETNHHGDGGEGCEYCELIIAADKLQREAIGLEPRPEGYCPACDTERPDRRRLGRPEHLRL